MNTDMKVDIAATVMSALSEGFCSTTSLKRGDELLLSHPIYSRQYVDSMTRCLHKTFRIIMQKSKSLMF
jgi:hypothetical protein